MTRVDKQPAFVLHRRAFRDTSLTIELFSQQYGRVAAVARAARAPKSPFFGLGEPFRALEVGWIRRGEMATLVSIDPLERSFRLVGRALWCGLYANELLIRLLPRDDPEPELFQAYARVLSMLSDERHQAHALRQFELALLTGLGVAPDLSRCADAGAPVEPGLYYSIDPVIGPRPVAGPQSGFPGRVLLALADGTRLSQQDARKARVLMRQLIDCQLDGRALKTPALFRESGA
ncbi:MAG: DNA repair protein RecO [Xanthomonadaceae bacterium]|nr:DNA repair protein RecO [Xanthomonadaceae bacterium]